MAISVIEIGDCCMIAPLPFSDHHISSVLPRMIANCYDFRRKRRARGRAGASISRGEKIKTNWLSTSDDPICREICVLNARLVLHSKPGSPTLFLSPPSRPNRVSLPGQKGGGGRGREVIQGSRIYRWQTSLPP